MVAARWRHRMLVSLLVLMAGSAPAQAVNKCVGADGRSSLFCWKRVAGSRREAVVKDRRSCCPAETAAFRIESPAWLESLPRRERRVA